MIAVNRGYSVERTRKQLWDFQEELREQWPEYDWPLKKRPEEEEDPQQLLEVAQREVGPQRSAALKWLLDPRAWPIESVASSRSQKGGMLERKKGEGRWKKRIGLVVNWRWHLYGEEDMPRSTIMLPLCVLDVTQEQGQEVLKVDVMYEKCIWKMRWEDRLETAAWIQVLRSMKNARMRQQYWAKDEKQLQQKQQDIRLDEQAGSLFKPLTDLKLDLVWKPSLNPDMWPADASNNVMYTQQGRLRAASPFKLVEKMLDETQMPHQDVVTFLLTFEGFMQPQELLDCLCSNFDRPTRGAEGFKMRPEQLRVVTVMTKWLEMCPAHFHRDIELSSRLFGWVENNFREDRPSLYKKILIAAAKHVWVSPSMPASPRPSSDSGASPRPSEPVSPRPASDPPSMEMDEKEKLRAAVRARMAAHNAVLGVSSTSAPSSGMGTLKRNGSGALSAATNANRQNSSPALKLPLSSPSSSNLSSSPRSGEDVSERDSLSLSQSGVTDAFPDVQLPYGWLNHPDFDLFEVPPVEVARQLTLLEFSLFSSIPLRELHGRGWLQPQPQTRCPHIMRTINVFNKVSRIVATSILRTPRLRHRAAVAAFWMRVLHELHQLNNFSACVSICGGIGFSSTHRLNATWSVLEMQWPREHQTLQNMQTLTASANNWTALRTALHSIQPPAVPYLGVYCSDLTFADQGNPSRIDGMINWDKCKLEAGIIRDINLFQQVPYRFQPVRQVQQALLCFETLDDDTLYNMSLALEPRRK